MIGKVGRHPIDRFWLVFSKHVRFFTHDRLFLILHDKNDPFGTGPRAPPREFFVVCANIEALGGNVAVVIERIEMFGNRVTARITHAPGLFDTDIHQSLTVGAVARLRTH